MDADGVNIETHFGKFPVSRNKKSIRIENLKKCKKSTHIWEMTWIRRFRVLFITILELQKLLY